MDTKKLKKTQIKYDCEKCDFHTSNKNDFKRHCETIKHMDTNGYKMDTKKTQKQFVCECGKTYKYSQGLSKHKKTCRDMNIVLHKDSEATTNKTSTLVEMFLKMIEENKEIRNTFVEQSDKLLELAKQPKTNIQTQNNNTTFNVLNYLNTECADALNLTDFVNQIQITFEDLLLVGNKGFISSIEHSFVDKLKSLEQTKRPIHCTDKKRKSIYVKEDNKWNRDRKHDKISNALDGISSKQYKTLSNWFHANPRWNHNNTTEDIGLSIMNNIYGFSNDKNGEKNKKNLINKIVDTTLLKHP